MGVLVNFEDRAVAFIDVLGFKSLVAEAVQSKEQLNQLSRLIDLLSSAVPALDSTVDSSVAAHLIPAYLHFRLHYIERATQR